MGAAGAASGDPVYVDDVFNTFLYEGTGSARSINNGIDLSGEGGLVWIKNRDNSGQDHVLNDTERGAGQTLRSDSANGQFLSTARFSAFNSNGFSVGTDSGTNNNNEAIASWTFRKAPGFFDVVTWTGNATNRVISHNLGSVPGMIMVKRTDATENWHVYHRSTGATKYLILDSNNAEATGSSIWNDTTPTSTNFTVGTNGAVNGSGGTYVAYVFAHDDQSFGTDSDESIIKCGSYSSTGFVDLGFEPQWVMIKSTSNSSAYTGDWRIFDNMRGIVDGDGDAQLFANEPRAEDTASFATAISLNATGFTVEGQGNYGTSTTYMAIRRPNKPPEAATEAFFVTTTANDDYTNLLTSGFPVDLVFQKNAGGGGFGTYNYSRLAGSSQYLNFAASAAEGGGRSTVMDSSTKFSGFGGTGGSSGLQSFYALKRAPGFFDVVAYSGNGVTGRTINHNLEVVPEFMLVKRRSGTENWYAYHKQPGATKSAFINSGAFGSSGVWNNTTPTATTIALLGDNAVNGSGQTYVGYLFSTLSGISKVGSYSGTGNNVNVDCGFTSGARFILIKRTDSSGDWYVWDTARGINSGNDPYFLLNGTTSEVTNTDYIDPLNAGFTVTSSAPAALNASGGTYMFLAIA